MYCSLVQPHIYMYGLLNLKSQVIGLLLSSVVKECYSHTLSQQSKGILANRNEFKDQVKFS